MPTRRANVDNGVSAFWERLATTIRRWTRSSKKVTEHGVRNEVAENEQSEKHNPFGHADPDAVPGVKLVEDPDTGNKHAATDLEHRLQGDMAANGLRDVRVALLLVWFGLRIHRCLFSGEVAETPHAPGSTAAVTRRGHGNRDGPPPFAAAHG